MSTHTESLTKQVFTFVSKLYEHGVDDVVISPGSRSTPLAIACERHPHIKTWIHPDERSAAFFALGIIKANQNPVAIICTSGTAASNYTPAVSEAYISKLPLIVVTSDRPHELRNIGAPQAINQVNMFQNFTKFQIDMPLADESEGTINTININMIKAEKHFVGPQRGPVHFNFPFREPLLPDVKLRRYLSSKRKIETKYQKSIDFTNVQNYIEKPRGVVVVGDTQGQDLSQILTYSAIHNIPVLADPLSNLRGLNHPNVIATYDALFKGGLSIEPQFIIRVGQPVVSKQLNNWLKEVKCPQILVQNNDTPDAFPKVPTISVELSPNDFFRQAQDVTPTQNKNWLKKWQAMEKEARALIDTHIEEEADEGAAVGSLLKKMTSKDTVFVGNSMPIRDVDTFNIDSKAEIAANRGANGIDGVVSTALGMSVYRKVTLIIGDISFFHDMNGLIMSKAYDLDITIICLNNNGGGIFNYLPQKEEAPEHFEKLFGTPLNLDFQHVAHLFELGYEKFENVSDYKRQTLPQFGSYLYEIMTNRQENTETHRELFGKMKGIQYVNSLR